MAEPTRLYYLLEQYTQGRATEAETDELFSIIREGEHDDLIKSWMDETCIRLSSTFTLNPDSSEVILQSILGNEVRMPAKSKWMWRAAAVVLVVVLSTTYFLYNHHNRGTGDNTTNTVAIHDVRAPTTNRATITLSNGTTIFLDSARTGQLATEGNTSVRKIEDGKIAYQSSNDHGYPKKGGRVGTNMLTNPRGSKIIDITLSDGSRVWLNAASSITYPVEFTGSDRRVSISGEAYFEVTHNPTMPFHVMKGNVSVEVLGTHFNVNAYDDEANIKVTLLEGSVKVASRQQSTVIKPGQQARVTENNILVDHDIDTDEVMAWKNGKFRFGNSTDVPTIMRQVARWYDVDVMYQDSVRGRIGGSISRDVNASKVFKMLETTGVVQFRIEGKKVTVLSGSK